MPAFIVPPLVKFAFKRDVIHHSLNIPINQKPSGQNRFLALDP